MEKKVLSEKSPLFGRRDSQMKLDAFDYLDSAKFVPDYSNEDKAVCYGITGGIAKYLSMIDPAKSMDENIIRLFFRTDGYLYDETRNLLTQEFSDIAIVNNIVEQIASGENTLNTIAGKIGEKECVIVKSGVGKVNAARTTQAMIDNFDIEYIINMGASGSIANDLNILICQKR